MSGKMQKEIYVTKNKSKEEPSFLVNKEQERFLKIPRERKTWPRWRFVAQPPLTLLPFLLIFFFSFAHGVCG